MYGGGALPATPLSVGANMYINPPDLQGGGPAVVQYAMQFVGMVPYIMGGNSPSTGFTCDTFVRYVYAQFGVHLTGNAVAEAAQGTVIPRSEAVAGDLVYYPHQHIGIYDGNGGIVDAPKPGKDVSHRPIWGNPEFIRL
ncbi:C40 family peptidase [Lacisediminihabitans sp.]|uniref:C40 family peptidase n=1 Tax=Lacisediminihabitans sp. TaxID=2787631 RepID=UPI00374D3078